jgi:hypothetical protein
MRSINLFVILLAALSCYAQDYRKDLQTRLEKENPNNAYQTYNIDDVDLLKALDFAGIRIFKIPLSHFDKKYKFSITLSEYVRGKLVESKNISPVDSNIYYHFIKNDSSKYVQYFDFIDQVSFFSKESDTTCMLRVETYSAATGAKLNKMKERPNQFYSWRTYSKNEWILNKSIPVLVYASSWYDKKYDIERFCGVVDLSYDKSETDELMKNSPHYYTISLLVTD